MKKLFAILLLCALVLGMAACQQAAPRPETGSPAGEEQAVVVSGGEGASSEALYMVRLDSAPYNQDAPAFPEDMSAPGIAVGSIGALVEQDGDFLKLSFAGNAQAWIHGWYLTALDENVQRQREEAQLQACTSTQSFQPVEKFLNREDHSYICLAGSGLNCRALPSGDSPVLITIPFGTQVEVLGRDGDYYLCRLDDGGLVYCAVNFLSAEQTYVELDGAVDLRVFLPTLEFEMLFASPNNITGEAMYPAIPLLETSTAKMLAQAQDIFRENGYSIKIYDAYRPKSAQFKLYDIVQNSWFIANPYTGNSWHQLGRAVDMSLIDLSTGEELEMPTPMHTFDTTACRFNSGGWTETARANVNYMTEIMTSLGFGTITTEWWHFENTADGIYMDPYLDYDSLTYRPITDYVK